MPGSFTIKGIAPFDLQQYPDSVKLLYWSWVTTLALKAKDRDLAAGLDAFGVPLRPISKETRKRRVSAMTPTGKGDPSAPPLSPGHKLSRVRSLLAGRALVDRAELWWRFDPFTHASFSKILTYQAEEQGRDVFGLSPESTEEVRLAALRRWRTWLTTGQVIPMELEGRRVVAPLAATGTTGPLPTKRAELYGHAPTEVAVFGIGGEPGTGAPIRGFSEKEFKAFYRQTMPANVQARPGTQYNRMLRHIWGEPPARGRGAVVPKPPRPPQPAPQPVPKPPVVPASSLKEAKQIARAHGFPEIPSKPGEAAQQIHDALIESDVRFRDDPSLQKEALRNWKRELRGRMTDLDETIALDVQNAINKEMSTNDLFRQITEKHKANVIQFVKPEKLKGTDEPTAMRIGAVTHVYDPSYKPFFPKIEESIPKPGEIISTESGGLQGVIRHEYGHYIDNKLPRDEYTRIHSLMPSLDEINKELTGYASENRQEAFAELFAVITHPQFNASNFAPWVGNAGKELLEILLK